MRCGSRGIRVGLPPAADRLELANLACRASPRSPMTARAAISRGMRSCRSSSAARTIGSAWNRSRITPSEQGVGDRDDRHSLVVGHERADDRDLLSVQQSTRREVERLEKSEAAARADEPPSRVKLRAAATGSTIAASAVA